LQPFTFLPILNSGFQEIVAHDADEIVLGPTRFFATRRARARRERPTLLLDMLRPQRILLLSRQDAMRRQALHRETAGYTDFASILVRPIDEVFDHGVARDRGIDLFLPFEPRVPPLRVQLAGSGWPIVLGLPQHLPLFPCLVERLIQSVEQRTKYCPPFF